MTQKRLPELEKEILELWREKGIFEKSVGAREDGKPFVFFEGPPTANALPATHHVIGRSFKDVIPRFKTMQGYWVWRRAGWDTHGLPVELEVEKALGLSNKKQIEHYGIAAFNKKCRESVWKYKQEWERLTERMGFWIDMEDPYITYETRYIENLWNVLSQMWNKKLLFKDFKVVPYCVRCGTPISSHEVAQGYETVKDRSVYVKFEIVGEANTYFLAWTTTPWTLPGNVALAVGENIEYTKVKHGEDTIIVASERVSEIFRDSSHVLETVLGKNLVGLSYKPLFDYKKISSDEKAHKVYAADFVSTEEGTGIVHTAVMYGVDDFELGTKLGLPKIHTVDQNGVFLEDVPVVGGMSIVTDKKKDENTEKAVISYLKENELLFSEDMHEHEYPFCWRCHSPLLYYARDSWFIGVSKKKDVLIKNNSKVNWIPEYIKQGRFGEWLKEAKDWAISRERYWGTPLPIWKCDECGEHDIVGSLEVLNERRIVTPTTFLFMRHGEAPSNVGQYISSYPEKEKNSLTKKGREMVTQKAQKLKSEKIDVIYSSDIERAKETAEIVAQELGLTVIYNEKLREVDAGPLNGESHADYHHYLDFIEAHHKQNPLNVESYEEMCLRIVNAIYQIQTENKGKRVLVVGHGGPLLAAEFLLTGRQYRSQDYKRSRLALGDYVEIEFPNWPFNEDGEVDLHRPYIDEIEIKCGKCGGVMKRIPELADVWFDSGSMPFAQGPASREYSVELAGKKKLGEPIESQFPADYIAEGIDQTRGWFYTLHVVSTLLGYGPSYKNVITYGHLLDKNGKKMSKSVGNVVDPWEMMEKYGSDTLRWYFYTVNSVGDPTLFDEDGVKERERKFVMTVLNSLTFLETYWDKTSQNDRRTDVLDKWIEAELHVLIDEVTASLEAFDIVRAARRIDVFVENLSNWYIRRSRERLQSLEMTPEKAAAQETLFSVLTTLSKLLAPFTPFLADQLYRHLQELSADSSSESVHIEDWPKVDKKKIDHKLISEMKVTRELASAALAQRAAAGIKVRQPLSSSVSGVSFDLMGEGLDQVYLSETNTAKVIFDSEMAKDEVKLNTSITPELLHEGRVREIVRAANALRKEAGLVPQDRITLYVSGGDFRNEEEELLRATRANAVLFTKEDSLEHVKELTEGDQTFWVGIKKV